MTDVYSVFDAVRERSMLASPDLAWLDWECSGLCHPHLNMLVEAHKVLRHPLHHLVKRKRVREARG